MAATSVLVVANETLVGDELVETLRRRAERGPIRVVVVAPITQPREGYVVYRDSRRAAAGRRLNRVLDVLRGAGIPAHGEVFDDEPLAAVKDLLAAEEVDEIVVCTHPETRSGWLRKNLVEEIRRAAGDRPVEHVVSDVSGAYRARTSSSSRTRPSWASRSSIGSGSGRARAPRASSSCARRAIRHAASIRRPSGVCATALSILRSEGLDAHGQVAHPDPFVAAMEALEDDRTDEIIVSTFPGERSGWLRRDLVGRLRSESGLPVHHVVVEDLVEASA